MRCDRWFVLIGASFTIPRVTQHQDNVFIALGSNLGDRLANLRSAVARLEDAGIEIVAHSSVYETQPVDARSSQDDYYNAVIQTRFDRPPLALLDLCLSIESKMGRIRRETNEARVIDLDILLFGDQVIRSDRLTAPHPRLHVRRFVLKPLAEIAPDVIHPIVKESASELLAALPNDREAAPRHVTDTSWVARQTR